MKKKEIKEMPEEDLVDTTSTAGPSIPKKMEVTRTGTFKASSFNFQCDMNDL